MSQISNRSVDPISQRKQDHISAFLTDPDVDRKSSEFDQIKLIHRALPELDYAQVSTETDFLGKTLSFPLLISSMTGGQQTQLSHLNQRLAEAAEACQVAMAVGSQRVMITQPEAKASFQLRQYAPTVPLIANMGAVQLNYGFGLVQAEAMIDALEADALYLHLNPLQELIQPEGDTNFAKLIDKIANLQAQLSIPVLLKEVGCGFSALDFQKLQGKGIKWIDVAGQGGSSWSRVESHRSLDTQAQSLGLLLQDWGVSTVESLRQAQAYRYDFQLIASGGIRNGLDMVKSVIMGAQICGIAAPLLKPALESTDAVIQQIERYRNTFQAVQFLLGAAQVSNLRFNSSLILTDSVNTDSINDK